MLRDYQQAAFDAAKDWLGKSLEPAILDLATGAGKSHIISAIAEWLQNKSGKKILCLAPSKELVEQNREKYLSTGNPASLYCASLGKDLRHDVVFGSPQSVKNDIDRFCSKFCAVIIDECHGITPTIKDIVAHIKSKNPKCRVLGLTATPYRLNTGYIYQQNEKGNPLPEHQYRDPYFLRCLYMVSAQYLIDNGYLTPPHADPEHIDGYSADGLTLNKQGKFDAREVEQVFEGKGRKTALIVADIVDKSRYRQGVLIFAATLNHAKEVIDSLPQHNSRVITGSTSKSDREKIINDFKHKRFKYLVNVAVLTTGFDAPHVDVVAVLRATESVSLLQQIIGRGLRLANPSTANDLIAISKSDKPDCLVLDYAKNIERHCPDGDLFNPKIEAKPPKGVCEPLKCRCPNCSTINEFTGRDNPEKFEVNDYGYFVDLAGSEITNDDDQPVPAHHGRRCSGGDIVKGAFKRCDYRWSFKACLECDHENDIAARFCEQCKSELVDPNEKLVIDFQRMKKDPYSISTDKVLSWRCQLWVSQAGNDTVRVDYTTDYNSFSVWYAPSAMSKRQRSWESLCNAVFDKYIESPQDFIDLIDDFEGKMPRTITARKDRQTKFFEILAHNEKEDLLDEMA